MQQSVPAWLPYVGYAIVGLGFLGLAAIGVTYFERGSVGTIEAMGALWATMQIGIGAYLAKL